MNNSYLPIDKAKTEALNLRRVFFFKNTNSNEDFKNVLTQILYKRVITFKRATINPEFTVIKVCSRYESRIPNCQ